LAHKWHQHPYFSFLNSPLFSFFSLQTSLHQCRLTSQKPIEFTSSCVSLLCSLCILSTLTYPLQQPPNSCYIPNQIHTLKNMFSLVYDSYTGVSLWHFHIFIYCIPVWFIPSTNLPLLPLLFLKWLWQVSMFHLHTCIKKDKIYILISY
jgi:hypothetical protein